MLLISVDRSSKLSLQEQIVNEILTHIEKGVLAPGSKIPSSRMLAKQLKLSRNTVMNAYQRLLAEGFVETAASSETRVCEVLPKDLISVGSQNDEAENEALDSQGNYYKPKHAPVIFSGPVQEIVNKNGRRILYDFWVGRAHQKLFPSKIWQELLKDCIGYSSRQLAQYGDPAGLASLRDAIAEHVRYTRAIPATADQIVITVGIQEALNIVARLFVNKGDKVLIENPCYQGAAFVFRSYGVELVPIRVDSEGLDVSKLPEQGSSLIYTTPSHQYPTGVTMSLERREKLIAWAERTGTYIIEDDYDSDFRYDSAPLHALSGLSKNGHVIYMGTFSKSVGAGLRLGYMVLPQQLVKPAVQVKTLMNNHNGWLDQAVMAKFIQEGHFERHLRMIRHDYKTRRDVLIQELRKNFGNAQIRGADGGMHITWKMPKCSVSAEELKQEALKTGVGLYTMNCGGAIELTETKKSARDIVLGYSSLDERQIVEGIRRVRKTLNSMA